MENSNGSDIVGLVPRVVALALAVTATAFTSVGTAVLLTSSAGGSRSVFGVVSSLQAFFGG